MTMTRRTDVLLATAAGLAALLVYIATVAPGVLPGDSGEFQFAAPLLGLAHPTGYPLYLILGKVWTAIVPFGDAALRMNLFSAVAAAGAVGLLYVLARRIGLGTLPSLMAAMTLAFSHTFWSQAVRAEVYALNSLFTVALLCLAVTIGARSRRGTLRVPWVSAPAGTEGVSIAPLQADHHGASVAHRRVDGLLLALCLTLGLSLTHHRMTLLLIPSLLLLVLDWPHLASRIPRPASRILHPASRIRYLAALVLPLLLYLYLPLRAAATPYARLAVGGGPELVLFDSSLDSVVGLITGSVFRGSLGSANADLGARLAMASDLLRQQVGLAGVALAALGALVLLRRRPLAALALLLAYGAVVAFCLVYFIGDIADLFTPSYIIVALLIGAGVHALAETAARAIAAPASGIVLAISILLPLALVTGNWRAMDMSGQTATRAAWQDLLRQPLPSGATLVSNDRDEMTPMWYMQYVEGQRRDLVGLFPQITPAPEHATFGALLDWLLARGQHPYLIKPMRGLEIKYRLLPAGAGAPLEQVAGHAVSPAVQPQMRLGVSFDGGIELVGADVQGTITPGGSVTVTLYWTPQARLSEDYHVFVQFVNAAGERVQGSDHRPGGDFYPTSAWRPGDMLADHHVVALPAVLPPGDYTLLAGVYRYPAMTRLAVVGSQETTVRVAALHIQP
jgi:hypothetical protein